MSRIIIYDIDAGWIISAKGNEYMSVHKCQLTCVLMIMTTPFIGMYNYVPIDHVSSYNFLYFLAPCMRSV